MNIDLRLKEILLEIHELKAEAQHVINMKNQGYTDTEQEHMKVSPNVVQGPWQR